MLDKVKLFNEKPEFIVSVVNHNSYTFAVTCNERISEIGILSEFELKGYILDIYQDNAVKGKPIVTLDCDVCYNSPDKTHKSVFIADFVIDKSYRNMGFGSVVMEQLVRYSERLCAEYIFGNLSFLDIGADDKDNVHKDNRERVYHFYNKFGFVIDENKRIQLNLQAVRNM